MFNGRGRLFYKSERHINVLTSQFTGQSGPGSYKILGLVQFSGCFKKGEDQRPIQPTELCSALKNIFTIRALIDDIDLFQDLTEQDRGFARPQMRNGRRHQPVGFRGESTSRLSLPVGVMGVGFRQSFTAKLKLEI